MSGKLFDFCIGNPPYQEETKDTSDKPVYDRFMDASYNIADKVELITPARFLFNAGKTPKEWNNKMLADPHIKILSYEQNSADIFPNTNIMGGICISYRDSSQNYGAIGAFSAFPEMNTILHKVVTRPDFTTLDNSIVQQNKWDLASLYHDFPEYREKIGSKGTEKRLTTPIFSSLSVFQEDEHPEDIKVLGLISNKRCYRYINKKYIEKKHNNLQKFKVIVPASNGSGAIGRVIPTPLIGEPIMGRPGEGFTQSFIGIGAFDTEAESTSALKYIKTKFARVLLGILKVTQHNHKGTWKYVPLQDFSDKSDIDWSKSIHEIDLQLYHKYGLSADEIDFIETHVKEMN